MPKKFTRDDLLKKILDSGIFQDPDLFHDGNLWCVSFDDDNNPVGRSFITIGPNLAGADWFIQRNIELGEKYP